MLKKTIQSILKFYARLILKRFKPEVIGVTGSAGKTSVKEAIFSVLSSKYRVRQTIKNYNNEIGLPLTIIGSGSPKRSVIGWLYVFLKASLILFLPKRCYPEILVLEMGVDHPGDMDYLTNIVTPNIGVVTMIGPVHLEHFGNLEAIEKEKGLVIKNLALGGWAVLNRDDERVMNIAKASKVKGITYGFHEKADVRAQELVFSFEDAKAADNLVGMSFKLTHAGSFVPVLLPKVLGYPAASSALAAAAVGIVHDMNLVEISQALRHMHMPPGRMNLIPGIKNTMVIDDTYNASPMPTIAALTVLGQISLKGKAKKFAVLGDMAELGSYSVEGHLEVGRSVVENKLDVLIVVGERSRDIARGAEAAGMSSDKIYHFNSADEAKLFVQDRIKEGDLILVKGSQSMRMEKIVKEIMAEPLRADELLVRQDWGD